MLRSTFGEVYNLVRSTIPEDPHYAISSNFPSLSPPFMSKYSLQWRVFSTPSANTPFINQNVFTPNHVSVTASTCGGVHALVTNGHRVFVGIWRVGNNLQLDGTAWGRCQRSPRLVVAVTVWFSVHSAVRKCWLMAGVWNMTRGTSELSASVLPLQSDSKFHARTVQRAKL